ncbi:hypothetical protein D3C80_1375460 [compost metagenome]
MNDNWIYVGADIYDHEWSKIGKTTVGLHTRHTSSQRPGYFIFTAYNIMNGDVHSIEFNLLNYLEGLFAFERQHHFSTGSLSECFRLNPFEMSCLVESFIEQNYRSSVIHENLTNSLSRYQCDEGVYRSFAQNPVPTLDLPEWCMQPQTPFPSNLNLSRENYFTGNKVEFETDLGGGRFVDHETGMEFDRDDDGNVEWKEPK